MTKSTNTVYLNGTDGFGKDWAKNHRARPSVVTPVPWNITCLRVSGLIQIFSLLYELSIGTVTEFFELFAETEYLNYAKVDYTFLSTIEINLIKAHRRMIKS